MPANKKYLSSPLQRILKITSGFIGGYFVMLSFHLMLSNWVEKKNLIITAYVTGYILWALLLLFAFMSKNGWKVWGVYIVLTAVFYGSFLLFQKS